MKLNEAYVVTCVCGQNQTHPLNREPFKCPNCGRRSIIDFRMGLNKEELDALLDTLDRRRDAVVKAIENRRDAA